MPARSPSSGIGPLRPVAQAHRVVISVGVAKPQEHPPCSFITQGVDEFLAEQPHGRRAEKDHALLVKADDSLIGAEVENLGKMVSFRLRRLECVLFGCGRPHLGDRSALFRATLSLFGHPNLTLRLKLSPFGHPVHDTRAILM